jgi:hypothetical protein
VTMQELDQLKCIAAVVQRDLKPKWAAERLGLTMRQVPGSRCGTAEKV